MATTTLAASNTPTTQSALLEKSNSHMSLTSIDPAVTGRLAHLHLDPTSEDGAASLADAFRTAQLRGLLEIDAGLE